MTEAGLSFRGEAQGNGAAPAMKRGKEMHAGRMKHIDRSMISRLGLASIAGIVAVGCIGWSPTAFAARPNSLNIYYLDSQDVVIGQEIAYCNNVVEHAGIIDINNSNVIVMQGSCDISQSPRLGITHFSSATGQTVDYLCNVAHPNGTPFSGFPGCDQEVPLRDTNLSPWLPG